MRRYRLTPVAEQDVAEIVDFISTESSPHVAKSIVCDIFAAVDKLADMPKMGHVREDLTEERVLFWSVYNYLIVYRPEMRPLEVIRVVSGRRDVRALLKGLHGA